MSTENTPAPDFAAIKTGQQTAWSTGGLRTDRQPRLQIVGENSVPGDGSPQRLAGA